MDGGNDGTQSFLHSAGFRIPFHSPLSSLNQPKARVASKGNQVATLTKLLVKKMAARLEEDIENYDKGEKVRKCR